MAEGERNEGTGTGFRGQQLLPSTRHKSISDPEKFETQDYFAMRGDGAPQHETGQRVATCCDELGACRSPDLPRSVTMLPPRFSGRQKAIDLKAPRDTRERERVLKKALKAGCRSDGPATLAALGTA